MARHSFDASSPRLLVALFGAYPTRFLLSLSTAIGLVALCFHLPLDVPLKTVGWQFSPERPHPLLDISEVKVEADEETTGVPITFLGQREEESTAGDDEEKQMLETEALPAPAAPPIEKLKVLQVLDHAEKGPSIVGGIGAYYIHIQYPEEAIAQNIQGRLILDFIVEPDGRPSHIRVLQSLHPLCDSSAVAALQKTHFVPGRQNGETVRVRMRLPVKFKLLGAPTLPAQAETDSTRVH